VIEPYYQEDGITIYHARAEDVLPQLPAVDLLLTDPPYGIDYQPGGGSRGWTKKTFTNHDLIPGDQKLFDPRQLLHFPKIVLFGANHYAHLLPPSDTWLVWDKRDGRISNSFADCEIAWSNLGGPARLFHHLWCGAYRASERGEPRVYPTQKPIALMKWVLSLVPEARLILDPYMGSATTLLAAKELGIQSIGVDVSEKACEIAIKRLRQGVLPLEFVS
jgi:site-specific DNA-methyltransferase (adenine-specific)/modification methylase